MRLRYLLFSLLCLTLWCVPMPAFADSSYIACYFNNNGSVTWQWGLNSDNSYYTFNGDWKTTPQTKIEKFFSLEPYSNLCAACANAKKYYKVSGDLFGIFAATKNAGYNYPIVLNGIEVSPMY